MEQVSLLDWAALDEARDVEEIVVGVEKKRTRLPYKARYTLVGEGMPFGAPESGAENANLTVLAYGAGQDSTCMLYQYAYDTEWRRRYAPGRFVVVFSDTGDEHPATYAHVEKTKEFCKTKGIEFWHLTSDMGYHAPSWPNLVDHHRNSKTIGSCSSASAKKTCTAQLKIGPIYKWLEHWLQINYGVTRHDKKGLYEFTGLYGKVHVLIGIAAKEDSRLPSDVVEAVKLGVRSPLSEPDAKDLWYRWNIRPVYPLYEQGLDRQACQDLIESFEQEVPPPSNCMRCHFMSKQELVWLYRKHPEAYYEWVEVEAAKIEKWAGKVEKNNGVFGTKLLPEMLALALEQYGHWTLEMLEEWKKSHGHCVKSKY